MDEDCYGGVYKQDCHRLGSIFVSIVQGMYMQDIILGKSCDSLKPNPIGPKTLNPAT